MNRTGAYVPSSPSFDICTPRIFFAFLEAYPWFLTTGQPPLSAAIAQVELDEKTSNIRTKHILGGVHANLVDSGLLLMDTLECNVLQGLL